MANPKKVRTGGLGRGLDAIFLDNENNDNNAQERNVTSMLRISDIEPRSGQPRKNFDDESLSQLADSIAANGIIQPIAVRALENGFYQIIAGERRWRAAKMAGLIEVPVIIMETDDLGASELALIENIQRENLNPVEEAGGYRALIEEYGLTQEEVSRRVGRSRSAIANSLRLFDLPTSVLKMVTEEKLTAGHGRALLGLKNPDEMKKLADNIYNKGLSVRSAEEAVRLYNKALAKKAAENPEAGDSEEKKLPVVDYNTELERRVANISGYKIRIINKNPKKAKALSIEYNDNDDLEAILIKLCGDDFFSE